MKTPAASLSIDESLKAAGVHFLPWVGPEYEKAGVKLLVVAESHYSTTPQGSLFTRQLTLDYMDGHHNHRFWPTIAKTISGQESDREGYSEIWRSIAFYNYIQEIVAATARVRPTHAMWNNAHAPFLSMLDHIRPHAVLVAGKQLWGRLSSNGDSWRRSMAGAFINHPASFGFSWRKWHQVAADLKRAGRA